MTKDGKNLTILAGCQGLMMTANSLLVTTSALVGFALAENKSMATIPLALVFLAAMITTIPASMMMKRIGRRNGFMIGVSFGILGAVISSWSIMKMDFVLYSFGVTLFGVSNGFGGYYRFAAADGVAVDRRSTAISLVLAGGIIAAFIGPNMASWTRDLIGSMAFIGSYVSLVVVFIISMLLLLFLDIKQVDEEHSSKNVRSIWAIARQPAYIIAVLSALSGFGAMSLIMTATPLAMHAGKHYFSDTAFVIQWHMFAMYAPSFVTGWLIRKFGLLNIMLAGVMLIFVCVALNTNGNSLIHYWSGLFLLGIGWNFLFIGGTTLLTETYTEPEKAKAQALNDFLIFSNVSFAALCAGLVHHSFGWLVVNYSVLPLLTIVVFSIAWLKLKNKRQIIWSEN
ncbi:MAG: MFS transporter [Acidiferrobacterales bacterium]